MHYHFEWDPEKAQTNQIKHGIRFERAATVFQDSRALSVFDGEHSNKEERWITLGIDQKGTLTVVCHTFHEESDDACRIRIFSARKPTKQETKQYKDAAI